MSNGSAPRVRGTASHLHRASVGDGGSAPRVRGTAAVAERHTAPRRFSPACAGNGPLRHQPTHCGAGSAPRVRGTAAHLNGRQIAAAGSAPRVRGTVKRMTTVQACQRRFSPACAGNGCVTPIGAIDTTVQPRVCGERADGLASSSASAVQPRVCGERATKSTVPDHAAGSAPRVRGTAASACRRMLRFSPACAGNGCARAPCAAMRFSPACAGNGCVLVGAEHRRPVQPRVCGER